MFTKVLAWPQAITIRKHKIKGNFIVNRVKRLRGPHAIPPYLLESN